MDRFPAPSITSRHISALDGIRGIAIALVLLDHLGAHFAGPLHWGRFGVRLFFVLSGFLITGILLRCRNSAGKGESKSGLLKSFYTRRALRIFPIYYLTLAFIFLAGWLPTDQSLWWHLTYSTNWAIVAGVEVGAPHFWSLAVEEQFYLIWPLIILFAPRRLLLPLILVTIALGPLSRWILPHLGVIEWQSAFATTSCLDALGLGGLLAYGFSSRLAKLCLALVLPFALIRGHVFSDLYISLFFTWVIYLCASEKHKALSRVLTFRPLTYLGQISYGLYVYHDFFQRIIPALAGKAGYHLPVGSLLFFAVSFVGVMLVAAASWHFIEAPINRLKRFFPYGSHPGNSTPSQSGEPPAILSS